jgi:hypothetical protein
VVPSPRASRERLPLQLLPPVVPPPPLLPVALLLAAPSPVPLLPPIPRVAVAPVVVVAPLLPTRRGAGARRRDGEPGGELRRGDLTDLAEADLISDV